MDGKENRSLFVFWSIETGVLGKHKLENSSLQQEKSKILMKIPKLTRLKALDRGFS